MAYHCKKCSINFDTKASFENHTTCTRSWCCPENKPVITAYCYVCRYEHGITEKHDPEMMKLWNLQEISIS